MERAELYRDIAQRTQGGIYIGVVGPVRTGKSTFIKRFMDTLVIPEIENEFERSRIIDELPQSGSGKTVMTTQPKFVPNEAVKLTLGESRTELSVRMIDCVGYMVEGALGGLEEEAPRMVRTPWFDHDIPFDEAAEIGTRKVIEEHSTVGVVVLTDGSVTGLERSAYSDAEQKVFEELERTGKPYAAVLNCTDPASESAAALANELSQKYGVDVLPMNVLKMTQDDIARLLENLLSDFPIRTLSVELPRWMRALGSEHPIVSGLIEALRAALPDVSKVRDHKLISEALSGSEGFYDPELRKVSLGDGCIYYRLAPKEEVFYSVLSEE